MKSVVKNKKAKCPHCTYPNSYNEVHFHGINDFGSWSVSCESCSKEFGISIENPYESAMILNYLINDRVVGTDKIAGLTYSNDIVEYNFDLNKLNLKFNYQGEPLYRCDNCNSNLELKARNALLADFQYIKSQYGNAINYTLASRCPDYKFLVVNVEFTCDCGSKHNAKFYCDFLLNGTMQTEIDEYLLADVSGVDLTSDIDGLYSKTDIMNFLEKLLIRWNLLANQIIIATPFVGHQYLKREDKMAVWTWLLNMLDPNKAIFITRAATFNSYKSVLDDIQGLNHGLLKEYDLENKIIESNNKKNDFHAKFYSAIFTNKAEVMSGSANLVSGPSIENITFKIMNNIKYDARYITPLSLKIPVSTTKNEHWVEINSDDGYIAKPVYGDLSAL